jgi:hypothetical protein
MLTPRTLTLTAILVTWAPLLLLLLLGAGEAPPGQDLPPFATKLPAYKSGEPVFAFNGKDLEGWYTFLHAEKYEDPNKVFSVRDGMLHISGQGFGGITTKQSFKDYHLVAEWRWGDKTWDVPLPEKEGAFLRRASAARDAGILLHAVGEDGAYGGHWPESIEVQIIEGGVGDFIVVSGKKSPSLTVETRPGENEKIPYFQPGGTPVEKRGGRVNWWGRDPKWTDTLGFRGARDVERPHGEWNRLDVICDGDRITTILNGVLVNEGKNSSHTEGKITLQTEGAEIFYRKFEVRPLVK